MPEILSGGKRTIRAHFTIVIKIPSAISAARSNRICMPVIFCYRVSICDNTILGTSIPHSVKTCQLLLSTGIAFITFMKVIFNIFIT